MFDHACVFQLIIATYIMSLHPFYSHRFRRPSPASSSVRCKSYTSNRDTHTCTHIDISQWPYHSTTGERRIRNAANRVQLSFLCIVCPDRTSGAGEINVVSYEKRVMVEPINDESRFASKNSVHVGPALEFHILYSLFPIPFIPRSLFLR